MKQSEILELTNKILDLNIDKAKIYEFCAACANAKAIIENKLQAETMKITVEAGLKNLINMMGGK